MILPFLSGNRQICFDKIRETRLKKKEKWKERKPKKKTMLITAQVF